MRITGHLPVDASPTAAAAGGHLIRPEPGCVERSSTIQRFDRRLETVGEHLAKTRADARRDDDPIDAIGGRS